MHLALLAGALAWLLVTLCGPRGFGMFAGLVGTLWLASSLKRHDGNQLTVEGNVQEPAGRRPGRGSAARRSRARGARGFR